jgi:hypothetical protein
MDFLANPLVMMVLGLLSNLTLTLKNEKDAAGTPRPVAWVLNHPWRATTALLGAVAGVGSLHGLGKLNAFTAFLAGLLGAQILDLINRQGPALFKKYIKRGAR